MIEVAHERIPASSRPSARAATTDCVEWAQRLDGVEPAAAEPGGELPEAAILALAASVRRWHALQRPVDIHLEVTPGVQLTRRWLPLASVGIYVPRALVSTLVMCVVPAQVAGVERIAVATPPAGAGVVAAAARLLGVEEVWALGGPPAIAAFAYGTESIAKVDKIVGPGNAHVNEAKLLVSREVAIDLPAGPSEIVVLAGADADRADRRARARRPGRAWGRCRVPARQRRRRCGARARRGGGARARAPRAARRGGRSACRPGSKCRSRLRGPVVGGGCRRLCDRRESRPADRWPGPSRRRPRPGDLPQADDGATPHGRRVWQCFARPSRRSLPSRTCRRTRKPCSDESASRRLPAVHVGSLDGGAGSTNGPRPVRDRPLRRQHACNSASERAAWDDRERARGGQRLRARRARGAHRCGSRLRRRRAGEHRPRGGRRRPDPALRTDVRRAG